MQLSDLPFLRSRHLPRLIIWCGGTLIVGIVVVCATAIVWLHQQALADSKSRFTQLNLVLAEQLERSIESIDGVLTAVVTLAKREDFDLPASRARIQTLLARQAAGLPQARSFIVLDRNGDVIIDSRSLVPRVYNGADRENFAVQKAGRRNNLHIDAPVLGQVSFERLFTVSRRLETAQGEFAGVVLSAVDIGYFTRFFMQVGLGNDGIISMWRNDGMYLMSQPPNDMLLGRTVQGPIQKKFFGHTAAAVLTDISPVDNTLRMFSFKMLNSYPLFLVVSRSIADILAPWRRQAFALGIFGSLGIAVLVGLGFVLRLMAKEQNALLLAAMEARASAEVATKAAEEANRMKSKFFAGVSHDLRTPLNAIAGFSDLLLAGETGALSEKGREYVIDIRQSGKHLLMLLNDLLDLGKLEAGRLTIRDDDFSLRRVVSECLRLSVAAAEEAQVTLAPYEERGFGLRADPLRLRQILLNLLSNAIKFTPPGGRVKVDAIRDADGNLRISVSDSGIGMKEDEIATALEPYGQVVNDFTRTREGTGLGLPLVKAFIELHGGWLEVKSAPGQGSSFTVVLPKERVLQIKSAPRAA